MNLVIISVKKLAISPSVTHHAFTLSIEHELSRMMHVVADNSEIPMPRAHFYMNSEDRGLVMAPMSRLNLVLADQAKILGKVELNYCDSFFAGIIFQSLDEVSLLDRGEMM